MRRILLMLLLLETLSGCETIPVATERPNPFLNLPASVQTTPKIVDYLTPFNAIEMDLEQRWQSTEDEFDRSFSPANATPPAKATP